MQCIQATSNPWAISICTAFEAKHVNKHKYLFCHGFPLSWIVMNSPPKSTAVFVNALSEMVNLFTGTGAIICYATLAFLI